MTHVILRPRYAVTAIKKRLYSANPHVGLFALQTLESCVKNCGSPFHAEIGCKAFMEDLRELVKLTTNEKMREKILELIQVWAHAFRNDPSHKAVSDTLSLMRADGFKFPVLKESDAMFAADSAPQWVEGDSCHRCRAAFGIMNRKHHCRACGQIFCDKCSSKTSAIPKFGIEKEVRVCDECFEKLNPRAAGAPSERKPALTHQSSSDSSPSKSSAKGPAAPGAKTEQELQEEEDIQMAIALSKSEAEIKEREQRNRSLSHPAGASSNNKSRGEQKTAGMTRGSSQPKVAEDAELTRYLDREYWEQKNWQQQQNRSQSPAPSAPQAAVKTVPLQAPAEPESKEADERSAELENFTRNMRKALEMFVNRMNSNKLRGRPIANDSSVQSLFLSISNMHSQLIKYTQEEEDRRVHFEGLQDKLTEIRDARAALDALREEDRDRKRRMAEEADAIRQRQMAEKLGVMRQKKQEYLQFQRQLALQRIQDQERELQLRKEQQKYGVQPPTGVTMGQQAPSAASWSQQVQQQQMTQQPLPQQNMPPTYAQAYQTPVSSYSMHQPPVGGQSPTHTMYGGPPQYTLQNGAYPPTSGYQMPVGPSVPPNPVNYGGPTHPMMHQSNQPVSVAPTSHMMPPVYTPHAIPNQPQMTQQQQPQQQPVPHATPETRQEPVAEAPLISFD